MKSNPNTMNKHSNVISLCARIRDRANSFIAAKLLKTGVTDVVPAHGGIFFHLFGGKELRMKELADLIHRNKSTLTPLVNKLEKRGYVSKRKSSEDSRVTFISLTDKGEAMAPLFRGVADDLVNQSFAGLSDKEQGTLASLLGRVLANFDEPKDTP